MAVDFFQAQDQARRNTRLLVVLFSLAVLSLLLLTNVLLCITLGVLEPEQTTLLFNPQHPQFWSALPWKAMSISTLLMLLVITVVILSKQAELNKGGRVVAEALGGERLDPQMASPQQKVLLNVVAEMAIAAGVPVPPVYLLPENSINAFAAGYSPADAVIGMTQGCLDLLSRDELQGVVAHEFSHILNGDMRMNIRLIALLHGILFIGHAGYYLLRSGGRTGAVFSAGRSKNNGGGLLGLALGLMVLGYLGSFFGNLIKAAVSRQREFLADASAVQFTRNPQGIAGALKAIGAASMGSRVRNPNADEMSHLFFGEAVSRWTSLFATHPPLTDRIKKIEPSWLGQFPTAEQLKQRNQRQSTTSSTTTTKAAASMNPVLQQMPQASAVLTALPALLLHSSQHPPSAPALLCACLVQPAQLSKHWHLIKELGSASLLQDVDKLYDQILLLRPLQKLQLVQLAAPSLKLLSASQFRQLEELCQAMINTDGQQDLLESCLLAFLQHSVGTQFDADLLHKKDRFSRLHQIQTPALQLLSLCALQSAEPAAAWQAGLAALTLSAETPQPQVNPDSLQLILPDLIHTAPMLKKQLAEMLEAAVMADKNANENEALLLQLLTMLLEIPKVPQALPF
ncbi:M48 family metallopeptidase [Rheinheimera sp.]|uniref:M48 family metallopeptidase n=1 Tax=Rheinheimera sp. TaxID=1869214 RepID=UPI0027B93F27|nr:M48 family metallopeptidase [Rheinheimera sp.]